MADIGLDVPLLEAAAAIDNAVSKWIRLRGAGQFCVFVAALITVKLCQVVEAGPG
tara:strand:- start:38 stop:202 length:165 start_codon:yes stop_codon:yes gene_type:complete